MSLFSKETPNLGATTKIDGVIIPKYKTIEVSLPGTNAATATNFGVFFIADRAYELVEAREAHTTAGSDAGAVTLTIEKLTGTQALDAGAAMLASTWDLKGTANTVVRKDPTATLANRKLAAGDRVALKDSGTLTALAGVSVTLVLKAI